MTHSTELALMLLYLQISFPLPKEKKHSLKRWRVIRSVLVSFRSSRAWPALRVSVGERWEKKTILYLIVTKKKHWNVAGI